MATKFSADGSSEEINVPDGREGLKLCQSLIGGYVEVLYFTDGTAMLINEEGKINDLPLNRFATVIASVKGGLFEGDYISGNAIFLSRDEVKRL